MASAEEDQTQEAPAPREKSEIEKKLDEMFQATTDEVQYKNVSVSPTNHKQFVVSKVQKLNAKTIELIRKSDKAYVHPVEEMDHRPLIDKWRASFAQKDLIHTINQLHIRDLTMVKRDLERNVQIVRDSKSVLKDSNGFDIMEEKTGIKKEKLRKKVVDPDFIFEQEKLTYTEKKEKKLEEEKEMHEEHDKFMDELRGKKKELREDKRTRKQDKKKRIEERKQTRLQKKEKTKEEEEKKLEEKKKEIEEKVAKTQEERKKKIEEMNEETKKIVSSSPMFKRIQKNYSEKVLMPNLNKQKERLATIRSLHSPLDHDVLESYRKTQDEKVGGLTKELTKKRVEEYENHKKNYNYKEYESQFTNAIKEYDLQKNEEQKMKEDERLQMIQKKKSYGSMVKDNFKPKISKKKQLEMELIKEKLKNPGRKRYLNSARKSIPNDVVSTSDHPGVETETENKNKRKKIVWKDNPMRPKTPKKKEFQKINYLQELKETIRGKDDQGMLLDDDKLSLQKTWKKDIKEDLSQQEKYEIIKDRAKQLEEVALRKEKMLQVTNGGTMKDSDQVNDMIFESIRAKLSILEEINS